jgi:AraC-like DNA-binding protein
MAGVGRRFAEFALNGVVSSSADCTDQPISDYEKWMAFGRGFARFNPRDTDTETFAGWMRPVQLFGFGAFDVASNAPRTERTHEDIRLDGLTDYCALFQLFGALAISQGDQAAQLAVGDVALIDCTRPVRCVTINGSAKWMCVHLPREPLMVQLGFEPQGGICGHRGTLASRLLFDAVRDVAGGNGSPSLRADSYMQLAVYDLLGALFAPSDPRPVPRHAAKLFTRICGIIKQRCEDPDFGPSEAAAEAGISLRYLQMLFTKRGDTCREYIYSQRLDHAVRRLHRRMSLGTRQPLSEIAYGCGFRDYTHFARRFRQRFGHSPGTSSGAHEDIGKKALRASTVSSASRAQQYAT